MYAITGSTGHLGRGVLAALLKSVPAARIVAVARNPARAEPLASLGVNVRQADYDAPDALRSAFAVVDELLLISASEPGRRAEQHATVIDAAVAAGVKRIVYTSILRADTSALALAKEHCETEDYIKQSGLSYALLRNGWYTENYTVSIPAALEFGMVLGSSGTGRLSTAARIDYAEAAAAVLTQPDKADRVYELAGDESYTMADFAAALSKQAGKEIIYKDLAESAYHHALIKAGLPEGFAALIAQASAASANGALFDESHTLRTLIGRPTTPLEDTIGAALRAMRG